MICILHGYLLEGSGSNLWTRSMVQSLCRIGETVHLVCQENHPEHYPFIARALAYHSDGRVETLLDRDVETPGRCILHKPALGPTLPVYVPDRYEEFRRVVPMVKLPDEQIEEYIRRNVEVVRRVVAEHAIEAIHANHAVLMPQVAEQVARESGVPFAVMPHGSALEYAVKRDVRFRRLAAASLRAADRIFVIGPEMRRRVRAVFPKLEVEAKMQDLNLGVDTRQFRLVPPERRPASIERLVTGLRDVERGRTAADRAGLRAELDRIAPPGATDPAERLAGALPELPPERLVELLAEPPGDPKRPDADLERTLRAVDWARAPVLLFLGRLIAAKAPHAVLTAFPEVLRHHPDARLVIVGHGPLRAPLEAMAHALATGNSRLFDALTRPGIPGAAGGMPEVRAFLDGMGEADRAAYFRDASDRLDPEQVLFTGYLRHRELRHLFPCCGAAVFPSVVREAGPLVFLEALACGTMPAGTDFGGMRESLNALEGIVDAATLEAIRLSPEPDRLVHDIVRAAPAALAAAPRYGADLRRLAVERYDWTSVADTFARTLRALAA